LPSSMPMFIKMGFAEARLVVDVIDAGFVEGEEKLLAFELFADDVEGEVDVGWELDCFENNRSARF
jgi:hypothetical protein